MSQAFKPHLSIEDGIKFDWMGDSMSLTNNDPIVSTSSMFGDNACGEPLRAQHLVIDFTPDADIDNEFSQRKCCEFWSFVNSHPELKRLLVIPNAKVHEELDKIRHIYRTPDPKPPVQKPTGKYATSVLSSIEDKKVSKAAFATKSCYEYCEDGKHEYELEGDRNIGKTRRGLKKSSSSASTSTSLNVQDIRRRRIETIALNKKLIQWDKEHLRPLEPPGHPPSLVRAVLQRTPH